MTALSTHPAAEDLGRFIEGTLEDPAHSEVVEHIADCDDCRITVVDVAAFRELEVKPLPVRRWWVGMAAAAAIAITVGGMFFVNERRDPLANMKEASTHQKSRLVDARLSGFRYAPLKRSMRGGGDNTDLTDLDFMQVVSEAEEVLQGGGDDPKVQHARGVARLSKTEVGLAGLNGDSSEQATADRAELVDQRNSAIKELQSAADRAPDNATYQSDLAAALIASRDTANLNLAVKACDRALRLDRRSLEALFNRAKALELLKKTPDAITAYNHYLEIDPSSPWADEVRKKIADLQQAF